MTSTPGHRLAIDIGGTFTDTVLVDAQNRLVGSFKTPTTPRDPTQGALDGARHVIEEAGIAWSDISGFIHGTTLATNALIEKRGACVATLTNEGFRDILEIAYERRYSQYNINLTKPDLLVPRARAFTIKGRIAVDGAELEPLDLGSVAKLADDLRAHGVDAVAICLLHSYANPAHEQALKTALLEHMPDLVVSLSHEVSPEAREFDRLCTTIANAYIQPLMGSYLRSFAARFAENGLRCPILMMTASGGMTTLETAARLPIRLVESGPAGGAILAAQIAREMKETAVLSFDMGGTTAKLCLIDDFDPQTSRHFEIARSERFVKGSGMPVRIPVIDMIEIGAGGGSIAGLDRLSRVQVGPESAGSEPGPAGFGKGGTEPTVTDADIAQRYLDPDTFAEGRLRIDQAASDSAIAELVGAGLGIAADAAAQAIADIVDENMASAGRMHAVESGKDLGTRTMIAFGGNGPLHASRVARRCGVARIVVPPNPGVGSAIGFLYAPVSFEVIRSRYTLLDRFEPASLNALLEDMARDAAGTVRLGAPDAALHTTRRAFMRYHGQGHEIEIALPDGPLTAADTATLTAAFEAEYARQFSRAVPGMQIEILNWSVRVSTGDQGASAAPAPATERASQEDRQTQIFCDLRGMWVAARRMDRAALPPGREIDGPALIVEPQTTTLVSADFTAQADEAGNLILTRREGEMS